MQRKNRRHFLQQASFLAGAPALMPFMSKQLSMPSNNKAPEGTVILFQGDSITDAHRDKAAYYPNNLRGLGDGYAFLAAARLMTDDPSARYHIYNRGISGNKVYQLANRWKDDCLNLQPDVLSILIGVNDFWHTLSSGYDGTVAVYETDFRNLLQGTKAALPNVKLIIGEPFAVKGGTAINEKWGADFDAYRRAAKKIADEFSAVFIPYHSIFEKALEKAPAAYWCPDGVHPSLAGAQLMADSWLEAFGELSW